MEFSLLGAAAISVGFIYAVLWYEGGRTNAADCTRDVWDAMITAIIVGVAIGRLMAMVRTGTNPITHPADILIVRGGVDTIAAAVAAVITYVVASRDDPWWLADAAAPAALAGLSGWHVGCLARDACLGTRSGLPWAVTIDPGGVTRHPVEIYTALLLAGAVVAFIIWKRHRTRSGLVGASAAAAAALSRLVTEPLRPGLGGNLSLWYGAAAIAAIATAVWRRHSAALSAPERDT